ncbi:hypothetical protein KAS08_05290 [Candidatus Pacearchaeota archaeon]|nr:hypothetical protein [Candidatus Pacearchaeota archaeon]
MENTGRQKVSGMLLKLVFTFTFTFTFIFILFFTQVSAQGIFSEVITTTVPGADPGLLESIDRFYEISERSLKIGYTVDLDNDSAFKTMVGGVDRYIVVNNFSNDSVNVAFLGSGKNLFNKELTSGDYVIFKIDYLNLQFALHLVNESFARVELSLFETEIPDDVDYFELFDIQVRLAAHTIYSAQDLSAIIEFNNFGEGVTHVRVVYSVIDMEGKEYFTGIDEKTVETDEIMVKNFYTLKIPHGQYVVRTTIYYGDDQEATSEESFIYTTIPKSKLLRQPLVFVLIILASFGLVIFLKKRGKSSAKLL